MLPEVITVRMLHFLNIQVTVYGFILLNTKHTEKCITFTFHVLVKCAFFVEYFYLYI
jgi:hypothetical protein